MCGGEKIYKIQISAYINFFWKIATVIHLQIVYGYFSASRAKLNLCDRLATKPTLFTIWSRFANLYSTVLYR